MIRIGFTGTRHGATDAQLKCITETLMNLALEGGYDTELHHGDCVGADSDAHRVAYNLGFKIIIHPPEDGKLRAWNKSKTILDRRPYLQRNRDIVNATDVLVAAPATVEPVKRGSGTWATIRYAHNQNKRVIVIAPDGNLI